MSTSHQARNQKRFRKGSRQMVTPALQFTDAPLGLSRKKVREATTSRLFFAQSPATKEPNQFALLADDRHGADSIVFD
jgi:hypothetical protein